MAFALAMPAARRRVRETLRWVRGSRGALDEERDVYRTFVAYARCLGEALAAERPDARMPSVSVEGEEHLRGALAAGRGVVLVTAHVGPWDAAARALRRVVGSDVLIAMTREPDASARSLHDGLRERAGLRIVHVGDHPLDALPLLHHLKRGGTVAVQLDRGAPSRRKLGVELFGRPFDVPEGPFRLAASLSAPVVPVFVRRLEYAEYALRASTPIVLSPGATGGELTAAARRAVAEMEAFVRICPTQWFHFARMDTPQKL